MKTKLDRVPIGLSEKVEQEAKKRGVPKTFVYKDLEVVMHSVSKIENLFKGKKNEKPLFRF